jgi:hypothetical protein
MTDKELVIELNKIPYADVLRFSSKDIDFCNNSLPILILFPNSFDAVYNIKAEKYRLYTRCSTNPIIVVQPEKPVIPDVLQPKKM